LEVTEVPEPAEEGGGGGLEVDLAWGEEGGVGDESFSDAGFEVLEGEAGQGDDEVGGIDLAAGGRRGRRGRRGHNCRWRRGSRRTGCWGWATILAAAASHRCWGRRRWTGRRSTWGERDGRSDFYDCMSTGVPCPHLNAAHAVRGQLEEGAICRRAFVACAAGTGGKGSPTGGFPCDLPIDAGEGEFESFARGVEKGGRRGGLRGEGDAGPGEREGEGGGLGGGAHDLSAGRLYGDRGWRDGLGVDGGGEDRGGRRRFVCGGWVGKGPHAKQRGTL